MTGEIRKFESGATRDTDKNKLDYEGFLSPIVLRAYAEYLDKHRALPDGSTRDSDNWQGLFGEKHLDVCIKSMFRHFVDVWTIHRGFEPRIEKGEPVTLNDALGGVIFNAMAYWFKLLKEKTPEKTIVDLSE